MSARDSSDDSMEFDRTPPPRRDDGDEHTPDWLVGPEDGLSAEVLSARPAIPRLTIPGAGATPPPSAESAPPSAIPRVPVRPPAPTPPPAAAAEGNGPPSQMPKLGERPAAPQITPQLPRLGEARPEAPKVSAMPELSGDTRTRAFRAHASGDMDESMYAWKPSEEKEPVEAEEPEPKPEPRRAEPDASALQALRAWAEETPVDAAVFEESDPGQKPRTQRAPRAAAKAAPAKVSRPVTISFDWLANPRLWITVACVAALATIAAFAWPREKPGMSIAAIRKNATALDGRLVTVNGVVGDVFPVGGSWVYYLHQGRDTLVVFSRANVPTSKERRTVSGTVSTGFLEGVARPALFEQAP